MVQSNKTKAALEEKARQEVREMALEERIEALEDEVHILKVLCRGLAERCQSLTETSVEYER